MGRRQASLGTPVPRTPTAMVAEGLSVDASNIDDLAAPA